MTQTLSREVAVEPRQTTLLFIDGMTAGAVKS